MAILLDILIFVMGNLIMLFNSCSWPQSRPECRLGVRDHIFPVTYVCCYPKTYEGKKGGNSKLLDTKGATSERQPKMVRESVRFPLDPTLWSFLMLWRGPIVL